MFNRIYCGTVIRIRSVVQFLANLECCTYEPRKTTQRNRFSEIRSGTFPCNLKNRLLILSHTHKHLVSFLIANNNQCALQNFFFRKENETNAQGLSVLNSVLTESYSDFWIAHFSSSSSMHSTQSYTMNKRRKSHWMRVHLFINWKCTLFREYSWVCKSREIFMCSFERVCT